MDAAIDSVASREPLIDKEVEKLRLIATLQDEMNAPEIAETGLGNPDEERFKRAIDIVVEARGLPRTPDMSEVFTPEFLPPAEDRIYTLL